MNPLILNPRFILALLFVFLAVGLWVRFNQLEHKITTRDLAIAKLELDITSKNQVILGFISKQIELEKQVTAGLALVEAKQVEQRKLLAKIKGYKANGLTDCEAANDVLIKYQLGTL